MVLNLAQGKLNVQLMHTMNRQNRTASDKVTLRSGILNENFSSSYPYRVWIFYWSVFNNMKNRVFENNVLYYFYR
jgi:hypothetical protein